MHLRPMSTPSLGTDQAGHFTVAPELVVEILSPGEEPEKRDRQVKLKLYSLHGVQEYWIVNWQQPALQIYRRQRAQLQLIVTLWTEDTLSSPLLPGFNAGVDQIFPV
ncbi:MAG: Uma2 family endonuclease [Synechococcaceae cyanobacterium SM2_3_1]|nr:Uma2 family endonuclease [Synechococcaceae cyanobacterium SM2_3_1]